MAIDLTPEEQRVMDATQEVMTAIRALYGGRNPHNFVNEGIPAIHVLQNFARQHYVHRVNPEHWSDWTDDEESIEQRLSRVEVMTRPLGR